MFSWYPSLTAEGLRFAGKLRARVAGVIDDDPVRLDSGTARCHLAELI